MKPHGLLASAAALILAAPAFALAQAVPAPPGSVTVISPSPAAPPAVDAPAGSTVATVVLAPTAPPPPRVETPPPPPVPQDVWVNGHWRWKQASQSYVWIDGHYVKPPQPTAHWIPGRWVQQGNGWAYTGGHWNLGPG